MTRSEILILIHELATAAAEEAKKSHWNAHDGDVAAHTLRAFANAAARVANADAARIGLEERAHLTPSREG